MRTYPQKSVYVNNYYYFYIYIFRVNHSSCDSKKTPKTEAQAPEDLGCKKKADVTRTRTAASKQGDDLQNKNCYGDT
jgi:hypothetical protein